MKIQFRPSTSRPKNLVVYTDTVAVEIFEDERKIVIFEKEDGIFTPVAERVAVGFNPTLSGLLNLAMEELEKSK
jgi:hypothetical protein